MNDSAALMQQVRDRRDLPPPTVRRAIREAAGVSSQAVAQALGVTRQAVDNWERGRRSPRPPHLSAYAELLRTLAREVAA